MEFVGTGLGADVRQCALDVLSAAITLKLCSSDQTSQLFQDLTRSYFATETRGAQSSGVLDKSPVIPQGVSSDDFSCSDQIQPLALLKACHIVGAVNACVPTWPSSQAALIVNAVERFAGQSLPGYGWCRDVAPVVVTDFAWHPRELSDFAFRCATELDELWGTTRLLIVLDSVVGNRTFDLPPRNSVVLLHRGQIDLNLDITPRAEHWSWAWQKKEILAYMEDAPR